MSGICPGYAFSPWALSGIDLDQTSANERSVVPDIDNLAFVIAWYHVHDLATSAPFFCGKGSITKMSNFVYGIQCRCMFLAER